MEKITCQICGELVHSIQKHLNDKHAPGSEQPMTLVEYRESYPEAPLLSAEAQRLLEERRQTRAPAAEAKKAPTADTLGGGDGFVLQPLRQIFGLPAEGTKTKKGQEIPVAVMDYVGDEEYIPTIDPNYFFDIENLKNCLMGIQDNINVYLYGHSGTGKSTLFEQICARTKRRMMRIQHSGQTEESEIIGQWTVRARECPETGRVVQKTEFELGLLPLAMKRGWVYLADEFDRAPPVILSAYQAILEGKPLIIKGADHENRVVQPHPNFRFAATGNTNGSGDESGLYQATMLQDAATMERFGIVMRQEYMEYELEVAVIQAQARVSNDHARKIIDFCTRVRREFPNTISITIGPRVAINIGKIGKAKQDFTKGVELAYANRLPDTERKAVLEWAQRIFGNERDS